MGKNFLALLLLGFVVVTAKAQSPTAVKNVNLPELYRQIDEAIALSPRYVAEYEETLAQAKQVLSAANDEQKLMQLLEISRLYESFNGDSALVYTEQALEQARQGGYAEIEGECMARLAYLCTFLGSQTESLTILRRIRQETLTPEARCIYFRAFLLVYSNLSSNTQLKQMRSEFGTLYVNYLDSLLRTAPEGSEIYRIHRESQLIDEGKLDEALKLNTKRLNTTGEGSRQNAIVSYCRYVIYRRMGNMEMAKYWLCKSALDDVRNAVLDQMSLMSLAELLDADGDTERASRYISFTWECNRRYSPRMRSWQIAPLLTAIENSYEAKIERKSRIMTLWVSVVTILTVFVTAFLFYLYRQRKALNAARAQLEESNRQLTQTNDKLQWMNDWATRCNAELQTINKQLQEKQQ